MSLILSADAVEVAFGERVVLAGLDLEIKRGEAVAIVGANGAGKTTLLKVLAGVLTPGRGRVELDGEPLRQMRRLDVARRVAVVPQGAAQVFSFAVMEFVLMGFHATTGRFSMPSAGQVEAARQALKAMELEGFSRRPVAQLSGGELQRALMARAMVAAVDLWLLDEPSAGLDMRHQLALFEQVKRHVSAGGSAVAVLHDLALVHRFFDRVLVLKDGKIQVDGAPDRVLTPEVVSGVYGVSMRRGEVEGRLVWVAG